MSVKKDNEMWQSKTILILNSGTTRRRFVFETAKRLGLKTVVLNDRTNWASRFADDFIVADNYNHAKVLNLLRAYLPKHKIDAVVTFEEDDVELLAKVCQEFNFIGNSQQTATWTRNKYTMRQQLASAQISQPRFALVTNQTELQDAVKKIGVPAVIKPVGGTSGFFVVQVNSEEEAKEKFEYVRKNATPKFDPIFNYNQYQFLYESYLSGPEVSVEAITQNGQTNIVAVVDKHTNNDPYFVETSDSLPSKFDSEVLEKIERLVLSTHRVLGVMNGVTHTELCVEDGGPAIVEIASRLAGNNIWDGVKIVWGVDLAEQAFRIALGLPITIDRGFITPKKYWQCQFINIPESGIVSTIHGVKEAEKMENVRELFIDKEVGDLVLDPPAGFDTMGWVAAEGKSFSEAEESAEDAAKCLDIQIIPFDPESSVGLSVRKDRRSSAHVLRREMQAKAKIEKLRMIDAKDLRRLHVGVLGNIYKSGGKTSEKSEVANELMSVGIEIKNTLEARGYRVTFFDMNESALPIEKIHKVGIDIMFNVCERINDSSLLEPHGAALLDILQVPYTGSNPLALAFCIDKIKVKKLLTYHHIPTAKFDVVYSMDDEVDEELRYPLIVKPANTDNSIGITNKSVVSNKKELLKQLEEVVVKAGRPALVEEYIEGDEYDVSIVGNEQNLQVLPLSRSTFGKMPKGYWHIYPFESKFGDNPVYDKIELQRPAKIPEKLAKLITEIAVDTYNILDAHDYARVELRVDKDHNPYVIELNPNPSIGSDACTAKCAKLAGHDYGDFLELILNSAVKRYKGRPPFYHLTV